MKSDAILCGIRYVICLLLFYAGNMDLPPKQYLQRTLESVYDSHTALNRKDNFIDIRDCPKEFQHVFFNAWKVSLSGHNLLLIIHLSIKSHRLL